MVGCPALCTRIATHDYHGLLPGTTSFFDDNLNWLYRDHTKNINSFLCPGTQSTIRTSNQVPNPLTGKMDIVDLGNLAHSRAIPRGVFRQAEEGCLAQIAARLNLIRRVGEQV